MKNIYFLIAMIILIKLPASAQDTLEIGYNPYLYKKLINKEFANLISPQSKNILGNFASIDFEKSEINFAGNYIFENGSILGIKANGSSSDGILPIFSNSKFNSKIGLDIQYNLMDLSKKVLYYQTDNYKKYTTARRNLINQYELKYNQIQFGLDSIKLLSELNTLNAVKGKAKIKELEINSRYDSITSVSKVNKFEIEKLKIEKRIKQETDLLKNDSLKIELSKIELNLKFQKKRLADFGIYQLFKKDSIELCLSEIYTLISQKEKELMILPSKKELEKELMIWKAKELTKIQNEIEIKGFQIGWFSIGYGIENNSFSLINASAIFKEQVTSKSYLNHKINLQYSFYKYSPFSYNSFFAAFGGSISIQDNLAELSKRDISEKQEIGDTPGERTLTKSYSAYSGDYKTDLTSISFYGDFYYFLFDENKGAVHFYPEYKIKEKYEPQINLGFGFLMSYRGKDKNLINAEVYYNLMDIDNSNKSDYNLFKRSQIGMRFTFPIIFNSKTE